MIGAIARPLVCLAAVGVLGMIASCSPSTTTADPGAETSAPTAATEARDPNRLWCNEHGVYEDECLICHPELANKKPASEARDPNRLWCNEHGVYEDECYICHPELKDKQAAGAGASPAADVLMCMEHKVPEAECGICRPDALANMPVGSGLKVRMISDQSAAKAGVATAPPFGGASGATQTMLGRVTFNRNQFAMVTPLAGGVVLDVHHDVGDTVDPGDVMATVRSPEIAAARSEYRKALAEAQLASQTLARERDLHEQKISPRKDFEEAQAAAAVCQSSVGEARERLISLGVQEGDLGGASGDAAQSAMPVRAPFHGTVVERNAVSGAAVEAGDPLFHMADLSTMWMQLSVPEGMLAAMRTGVPIQASFDAYPGLSFHGEIQWVSPSVDQDARMVQARAVLPNAEGLLKDGMFGRATLTGQLETAGLSVPESAVQDVDGRPVVFKKIESDMYETRLIEVGEASGGRVLVLAGLTPQDEIVTAGSYIVKSELLKARLGAGCTHE